VEMAVGQKGEARLEIIPIEETSGLRMKADFRFD